MEEDFASIWASYQELCEVAGKSGVDYEFTSVKDARMLLEMRFGSLVWLCRVLELASAAFSGARPPQFAYSNTDASKNVERYV